MADFKRFAKGGLVKDSEKQKLEIPLDNGYIVPKSLLAKLGLHGGERRV